MALNPIDKIRVTGQGADGNYYEYTDIAASMYRFAQAYAGAIALGVA